ncbi:unnamed protein product [Onchocerca ochengi]|uniref:DUF1758 domain-containing protein n=1 Tax=Onchocerca ochengi TaxID=42157 RepID=A0A182DYV3_ONCOC|nr:unnamed protein product [Onchocerca ochengi]
MNNVKKDYGQVQTELDSGHLLLRSKVGPIIAENGYISKLSGNNTICSSNATIEVNFVSELKRFWELEMIDIHEFPNAGDDDEALKHFKGTVPSTLVLEIFKTQIK